VPQWYSDHGLAYDCFPFPLSGPRRLDVSPALIEEFTFQNLSLMPIQPSGCVQSATRLSATSRGQRSLSTATTKEYKYAVMLVRLVSSGRTSTCIVHYFYISSSAR